MTRWTAADAGLSKICMATAATPATSLSRAANLQTGADLLTETQQARLEALIAADEHVEVEATWGIYQRTITVHEGAKGRPLMTAVINSVASGVPAAQTQLVPPGGP